MSRNIKVVLVEPGKEATVTSIETGLDSFQQAVAGQIEAYYPFEEKVAIICNEEGKISGMTPNRAIFDDNNEIIDIVFGPFFICGCDAPDFSSLTDEQAKRYLTKFQYPERFLRVGGAIQVIRVATNDEYRKEKKNV